MGIENPLDCELPFAHKGEQRVGRRRRRCRILFVVVEYRINNRATSRVTISDHILNAAAVRVEKAVDPRLADKIAGNQFDVAIHVSLSGEFLTTRAPARQANTEARAAYC
jgi:hypothetical protein